MSVDSIFSSIDRILYNVNELFGHSSGHHIHLETSDDEYIISADDGSMVSMFELNGVLNMVDDESFNQIIENLHNSLSSNFENSGHSLQVVFYYDPEQADDEVWDHFQPSVVTSRNLNIDIEKILKDWSKNVSKYCATEKVWLVLWTRPHVLAASEKKKSRKNMGKNVASAPTSFNSQIVTKIMNDIRNHHHNFLSSVFDAFTHSGILIQPVNSHDMLANIRRSIDPHFTSKNWRPLLPGDPLPKKLPDLPEEKVDYSNILYPTIASQIWPRESEVISRKSIKIGDRVHSPFVMSLPPQSVRPFNSLFKSLVEKRIPWSMSILLMGEGMSLVSWKRMFTTILHFFTSNKMFNNALQDLKEFELQGGTIVGLKITCNTWVSAHIDEVEEKISKQVAEVGSAIQSWGSSDVQEVLGDPLLGFSASIPGLMPVSPAPAAAAPMEEATQLLPFARPALPWDSGSLPLRTPDGKILSFNPISSHQTSWVDIGVAPMGFGKSVWLNTFNLSFILQSGASRLPWLSIIDIGPSSSGLISLLKSTLPKEHSHLAEYHRLRMTSDYSINPFDLPLGFQEPTPKHLSFLVNFVSLLATPLGEPAPPEGVPGIARQTISLAYDELSSNKKPRIYNPQLAPNIQEILKNLGSHLDSKTSWWEVRDILFENGYEKEAVQASKYAVPLLADVAQQAKNANIRSMYTHHTAGGENITDFFWRACMEAINAYPILASATKFDIGSAKIVSLDLDEVAPRGGAAADRQSGIMYMLARHIVASHLFLMEEDVKFADAKYNDYQSKRIEEIRRDPKRICYDEVHRVTQNQSISNQLVSDIEISIREARKWLLTIGLYTQSLMDLPDVIVDELATNIFILGGGSHRNVEKISERLGLNESAKQGINNIHKPDKRGANFLGIFKTDRGNSTHILTNSLGPQILWAFSTTSEDMSVRNALYKKFDIKDVLEVLSKLYPGGIQKEVEKRKHKMEAKNFDSDSEDIINTLISELSQEIIDNRD